MTLAAEAPARGMPWWLKRHETLLAIILAIALVGLGAFNGRFLTVDNLLNQGRLMTEISLIALPMTFIIITGGIDLSVGAVVGLCAIMLGYSWKNFGFPLPVAIVFALAVGGLAGFVNGLLITRVRVPPLIMTIASLALYRGFAEGVSQGRQLLGDFVQRRGGGGQRARVRRLYTTGVSFYRQPNESSRPCSRCCRHCRQTLPRTAWVWLAGWSRGSIRSRAGSR